MIDVCLSTEGRSRVHDVMVPLDADWRKSDFEALQVVSRPMWTMNGLFIIQTTEKPNSRTGPVARVGSSACQVAGPDGTEISSSQSDCPAFLYSVWWLVVDEVDEGTRAPGRFSGEKRFRETYTWARHATTRRDQTHVRLRKPPGKKLSSVSSCLYH